MRYTEIRFSTQDAEVKYLEACIEVSARKVSEIYEGLRTDASDGEFALWSQDDLVFELHSLGDLIRDLDAARAQAWVEAELAQAESADGEDTAPTAPNGASEKKDPGHD